MSVSRAVFTGLVTNAAGGSKIDVSGAPFRLT